MTKSELIDTIARRHSHLGHKDIDLAVKSLLEQMAQSLSEGDRIEIRGFGSFSLHYRPPRKGRNPKTGDAVSLSAKYVPHFKPGKDLRDRVNGGHSSTLPAASAPSPQTSVLPTTDTLTDYKDYTDYPDYYDVV